MSSSDIYNNFDFIFETGKKIAEELSKDSSNEKWVEHAKEEYNNNFSYPENTYNLLRSALEKNPQLYEQFQGIISYNEDGVEQFFNSIFFPQENDEEEAINEEEDDTDIIFDPDDDQPHEVVMSALTPELLEKRQQKQIDQVSTTLYISKDLAYLLLKKFNWNSDRLMANWLENPEVKKNLLESFHVTESMVRDPLTFKDLGPGECEVCYNDEDNLYQLYCGHILCSDCWKGEMEAQISQGVSSIVCRIDDCYAEIMLSDVAKFCGEEQANAYKKFILEDQISRDNKLIHCSGVNCNQVLTIDSVGLCGVATCSCGQRICWRCQKDAHAPLTCEQLVEWNKLRDEMLKLSRAQSRWERRELRLMDYRRSHLSEVTKVNNEYNAQLKAEHDIMNKNELNEIKKLEGELKKITDEKLRQVKLNKIREKKNENKIKQQDRQREREQIQSEQNAFISAIQSPQNAKFYLHQLNESQELRAMEKYCTTDEEFIERMTKKCPKCKTPIQKNGGCNYMKCTRCGFEFCWLCGADWKTHGDHFSCNKYDGKIGNVGDSDDDANADDNDEEWMKNDNKKYYLPPMNSELRGKFARWNHYFRRYQAHRDAQRMEKMNRDNYRETLVNAWSDTMSSATANKLVDKVYRAIDVARSVLIYSYPTAYFMDMHSKAFYMFEMCQSNLEITNEKLVGMVERFSGQKSEEFEKFADLNDKYIDATLREVDNYT